MLEHVAPLLTGPFLAELPFPEINPAALTIPRVDLGSFGLGPFHLRWYALAYIAGLMLGWRYMVHLVRRDSVWKPNQARPDGLALDDFLFWAALGVIIGGRIGYVLLYKPDMIWKSPIQVFHVWEGGMAFHGGLLGVLIAIVLFARRRNIPMLTLGDLAAAAAPIGLFFGRCANFINGELYGRATDAPWAMRFPYWDPSAERWIHYAGSVPRHPSQLYEAFLEGIVLFLVVRFLINKRNSLQTPGLTAGVFLVGYGVFRTFVELFREPDNHLPEFFRGWFTLGMLYSTPMIIGGALLIAYALRSAKPGSARAA